MTSTSQRLAVALALACGAHAALAADPIKMAHFDPLSGPFAVAGESLGKHLQAAVDEVNAKGGVLGGTKLELIILDCPCCPG